MADRLHEAVKNDLDHTTLMIPEGLKSLQLKINRLVRDYESAGKIYSSEVTALIQEAVYLLKEVAVNIELHHLATMDLIIEAPEVPGE